MIKPIVVMLSSALILQGCAAAVVAGTAAGAVTAADDRRSIGNQIDDNSIEIKTTRAIQQIPNIAKQGNISVISFNGIVLLLGQVPSERLKQQAQQAAEKTTGIRRLHNQLRIGSPVSITTETHDTWLTSKVKTQLLADDNVSGNNVKVVTENSEVFLMGLVTQQEAAKAVEIARNTSGVERVIKVFEYIKPRA